MVFKKNTAIQLLQILFFLCVEFTFAEAQVKIPLPKQEQIHQLVRYYEENRGFNGNIIIAEEGKIIYENSIGWAEIEKERPLSLSTPFYLASISKQFTAMAIMILKERGKLNLENQLVDYFPELRSFASKVTIRNLLNHTSGLPDYFEMGWDEPGLTNAQLYERLVQNTTRLNFKPGHKYRYNNTGYALLSIIVEKVSGIPFYKFIDSNICEPLGMENTWVFDIRNNNRMDSARAIGYRQNMKRRDDYYLLTIGDGGIYSSIEDMFVWDRALYTEKLVSKETLEEIFKKVTLANGSTKNYGFGWEIGSNINGKTVYHSGGLAGFRNYIERQIEVENTILILTNNSFDEITEMRNILVKIMDGRAYEFPDKK